MNERIRQLADEAKMSTYLLAYGLEFNISIEKFAELIVKECVSQIENLSPGYDDYRNQIEDAFRRDCVEQVKQHFGVE